MQYLTELFLIIYLSGSFGFINYKILKDASLIEISENNKEDKTMFLISFSAINLCLFYIVHKLLSDIDINIAQELLFILSMIISITISVFTTLHLFNFLSKKINDNINKFREKNNLSGLTLGNMRTIAFDRKDWTAIFIYSLDSNKLLDFGYIHCFNDTINEDLEFILEPFETNLTDSQKMKEFQIKNSDNIRTYINTDKNIKIVILYKWE